MFLAFREAEPLAARLVQAAGVFIGDNLPVTAEDPQFVRILSEARPDNECLQCCSQKQKFKLRTMGI